MSTKNGFEKVVDLQVGEVREMVIDKSQKLELLNFYFASVFFQKKKKGSICQKVHCVGMKTKPRSK